MLTPNTQIPTASRGTVRSLVKAHSDWSAFLNEKGLISASAKNADLIEFALRHPALTAQIEAILNLAPQGAQADSQFPEGTTDTAAEGSDMMDNASDNPFVTAMNAVDKPFADNTAGFDIDSVLGPVDQFLAPLVKKELATALGPIIAAANKPAVEVERIVEVERFIEVEAGQKPRVALPKARKDKRTTYRTLFPSKAKHAYLDASLTLWTGVKAPDVDPFYVRDDHQMALLMTAIERGSNVWLTGPAGTGKSTMPEQACAHLGRPFVKIGMTRQTEIESLVGGTGLHNGATIWEDGALIKAMRCPGTVILIDELTLAPAGVQAIFQLVADDHRSYTLPHGEVVKAAEGVVFVIADNTTGCGDEGGLYAGTNISNAALVTRFKRMIFIDYLSAQKEAEALANHTACPLPAAKHLADFCAQARRMPSLQGVVISLRQMVGFVQTVQDGFSSKDAFETAISSRMPATEKATIEGLADLTWSNTFNALIHGKDAPAAPVAPSTSAASQAFADKQY